MRLRNRSDRVFNDYLLKLGRGCSTIKKPTEPFKGATLIPGECITTNDIVEDIFPTGQCDESTYTTRSIITPLNEVTFNINDRLITSMDGVAREYFSVEKVGAHSNLDDL